MAPDKNKLKPCPLLDRTAELMKARSRTLTLDQIASDTGLTKSWLDWFSRYGSRKSPTVRNVVCLYEYLSGSQLIIQ